MLEDMGLNSKRVVLGILLNVEIWTFLVTNSLVLYCIVKGKLYAMKDNPVYLITGFNLITEFCQLTLHALYIGPAFLLGDWIFDGEGSHGVTVMAVFFLGLWYLGSFIQILMALNRLFVVVYSGRKILTHRRITMLFIFCVCVATILVISSQILSPCCRIVPDPRVMSYSYYVYKEGSYNYSMHFIDLPLDSVASLICFISYITLFFHVYNLGHQDGSHLKKKELRLCFQFLVMFLTYTVTWSTFFIFPEMGVDNPSYYILTTSILVANCGVNAIVYLLMNKDIKHQLKRITGNSSVHSATHEQIFHTNHNGKNNVSGHLTVEQ